MDDMAVYVGEAILATLKLERQSFVVQSEQVEQGSMQIMHVDLVFGGLIAIGVGGAVADAMFDPASSQPDGEAEWIVISPIVVL